MQGKRVGLTVSLFVLAFLILILRVVGVMIFPNPRLTDSVVGEISRGHIYDREGRELAVPSTTYSFYARTKKLSDDVKNFLLETFTTYKILSDDELAKIDTESGFKFIARHLSEEDKSLIDLVIDELKSADYIEEDDLGLLEEDARFYAYPSTAGLVGFVGVDNDGLMGLEYSFDEELSEGSDLYTTIDAAVSAIAYEEIQKAVLEYEASYGTVGIMDVESGEILALVSYPSFDPNELSDLENAYAYAVSSIYEPGSVMKMFSAAYALEKGYVTATEPDFACFGSFEIDDEVSINCSTSHGYLNLGEIIQKSCNVGMAQVADHFTRDGYYGFLTNFGFGSKTDVPLTGLESGILRGTENWSHLSKYMIAIGQEIGTTTLQLLAASSVIARDGQFKTPTLVTALSNGTNDLYDQHFKITREVMSEKTADDLLEILQTVVSENGTAIRADVEGIDIAGKTGTGQVALEDGGGYSATLYNALFCGFAPANDPKLVIVVSVNKPLGDSHTGGKVAAPVFSSIMRRIIISTDYFGD